MLAGFEVEGGSGDVGGIAESDERERVTLNGRRGVNRTRQQPNGRSTCRAEEEARA